MKRIFFFLLILISFSVYSQPKKSIGKYKTSESLTSAQKRTTLSNDTTIENFILFYIPSSINNNSFLPAAISSFNLAFGDDKVELKFGIFNKKKEKAILKNSFGVSISAEAPEGVRTLFKYDKTPSDLSLGLTYTKVAKQVSYFINEEPSSEEAYWINTNIDLSKNNVTVFSNDTTFSELNNINFSGLVSFNHYFNSWLAKKYIKRRNIWSVGAGVGHFSNYEDLDDIVFRKGISSNNYFSESKSIIGKKGDFKRSFGLLTRAFFFYPISSPFSKMYTALGVNFNSFGIGTSDFTANSNFGVYISKRKFDEDTELLTDEFSFGIVAVYENINKWGTEDYAKNNFSVNLLAQIPLRWK